MPMDVGYGDDRMGAYYFNASTRRCEKFIYTGQGGNGNRFYSLKQCHTECGGMFMGVFFGTGSLAITMFKVQVLLMFA